MHLVKTLSSLIFITIILRTIPFVISEEEEEKEVENDQEEEYVGEDEYYDDHEPMLEEDRLLEYHQRNYTWPLTTYHPNTPGWRNIFQRRFQQIERMSDSTDRYDAWVTSIGAALVIPNFTESGWGLVRAPEHVLHVLKEELHSQLAKNHSEEEEFDLAIEGMIRPLYARIDDRLNEWVVKELLKHHEAWANVELIGEQAYGLRVYRNGSSLRMHIDRPNTHVISCILHVDHSNDTEPWPLVIEDFQGNTNEVFLESGDMLFYESSKCFHGRPRPLKGSWYSSIFVHYHPKDWDTAGFQWELEYAVPPHWSEMTVVDENEKDSLEELVIADSTYKEPECEHGWCGLKETLKWNGPAIPGHIISTGGTHLFATEELVKDEL